LEQPCGVTLAAATARPSAHIGRTAIESPTARGADEAAAITRAATSVRGAAVQWTAVRATNAVADAGAATSVHASTHDSSATRNANATYRADAATAIVTAASHARTARSAGGPVVRAASGFPSIGFGTAILRFATVWRRSDITSAAFPNRTDEPASASNQASSAFDSSCASLPSTSRCIVNWNKTIIVQLIKAARCKTRRNCEVGCRTHNCREMFHWWSGRWCSPNLTRE